MRLSESLMKALLCNLLSKTLKYKGMVCTYFIQACAVLKSPPYCFTCFQKELEEEEEDDDEEEEEDEEEVSSSHSRPRLRVTVCTTEEDGFPCSLISLAVAAENFNKTPPTLMTDPSSNSNPIDSTVEPLLNAEN